MTDQIQHIWRTEPAKMQAGFIVWEVMEFMPLNKDDKPVGYPLSSTECRDGSYVIVNPCHFWTEESANRFFNVNDYPDYMGIQLVKIPNLPKTNEVKSRISRQM